MLYYLYDVLYYTIISSLEPSCLHLSYQPVHCLGKSVSLIYIYLSWPRDTHYFGRHAAHTVLGTHVKKWYVRTVDCGVRMGENLSLSLSLSLSQVGSGVLLV
jgi:hypothetical protein